MCGVLHCPHDTVTRAASLAARRLLHGFALYRAGTAVVVSPTTFSPNHPDKTKANGVSGRWPRETSSWYRRYQGSGRNPHGGCHLIISTCSMGHPAREDHPGTPVSDGRCSQGDKGLYVTLPRAEARLEGVAASHGWSLDGIEIFELVTQDPAAGADYTIFHPAESSFRPR